MLSQLGSKFFIKAQPLYILLRSAQSDPIQWDPEGKQGKEAQTIKLSS